LDLGVFLPLVRISGFPTTLHLLRFLRPTCEGHGAAAQCATRLVGCQSMGAVG